MKLINKILTILIFIAMIVYVIEYLIRFWGQRGYEILFTHPMYILVRVCFILVLFILFFITLGGKK